MEAGYLGRKSGRGYYNYAADMPEPNKDRKLGKKILWRVLSMLINEAADALNFSIATRDDIDIAMTIGVNYPMGLLKWADELGIGQVYEELCKLKYNLGDERYEPSILLKEMAKENRIFYE